MTICAVVDLNTNIVVNTIVAEPTDLAPANSILVEIGEGVSAGIGYSWSQIEGFVAPAEPSNG